VPGAVAIRSDEIRKRLAGVSPLQRLGPAEYSTEMSARVYATVAERARLTLQGGHSAIVDAVYARTGDRQAIERVAADMAVPFMGIWLEAPEAVLLARVEQRRNDASDADAGVIRLQHAQHTGATSWRPVDASMSSEEVLEQVATSVQAQIGGAIKPRPVKSGGEGALT
jgi:predicted kinase